MQYPTKVIMLYSIVLAVLLAAAVHASETKEEPLFTNASAAYTA